MRTAFPESILVFK